MGHSTLKIEKANIASTQRKKAREIGGEAGKDGKKEERKGGRKWRDNTREKGKGRGKEKVG